MTAGQWAAILVGAFAIWTIGGLWVAYLLDSRGHGWALGAWLVPVVFMSLGAILVGCVALWNA